MPYEEREAKTAGKEKILKQMEWNARSSPRGFNHQYYFGNALRRESSTSFLVTVADTSGVFTGTTAPY